ncbi:hypothetical protein HK096_010688, partial [Nowakowskiella sp. JEL0078]
MEFSDEFTAALYLRNVNEARRLLTANPALVNRYLGSYLKYPILHAIRVQHPLLLAALLSFKPSLSLTHRDGVTPYCILTNTLKYLTPELLQLLIGCGLDVNAADETGSRCTPLGAACHFFDIEKVKMLVAVGACVSQPDAFGNTPLHHAAISGKKDIVEYLVAYGVNVDIVNNRGESVMFLAVVSWKCSVELISYLVEVGGGGINTVCTNGQTPLAVSIKNPLVFEILLRNGADPNIDVGINGITPLGRVLETRSIYQSLYVQALLNAGADPNKLFRGISPLWLAASTHQYKSVFEIYRAGALISTNSDISVIKFLRASLEMEFVLKCIVEKFLVPDMKHKVRSLVGNLCMNCRTSHPLRTSKQ